MDDQACPKCKTTKYRNPSLKLMVNVCGHTLCENCIELLFVRGSGACQECGIPLRRNNFRIQLFEDASVEKEVDVRKSILKVFNKHEDDFDTLRDYNDYLEEIENIVFNLVSGVDVEQTKRKIENYKRENQDQIKKNRSKLTKDEVLLEQLIEFENQEHQLYKEETLKEELQELKEKKKHKNALIDELMFSDLPAEHIIAAHKREISVQEAAVPSTQPARKTVFSSGIRMGRSTFVPVRKVEVGELFVYSPLHIDYAGPEPPNTEALQTSLHLEHIRNASDQDQAGGYIARYACQRALQEAFCGLFINTENLGMSTTTDTSSSMDVS